MLSDDDIDRAIIHGTEDAPAAIQEITNRIAAALADDLFRQMVYGPDERPSIEDRVFETSIVKLSCAERVRTMGLHIPGGFS